MKTIEQQIGYAATEVAKLEKVLREAHEGLQYTVECEKEADEQRVGVAKMLVYATKASRCIATLGRTFDWYEARRNEGKEDER